MSDFFEKNFQVFCGDAVEVLKAFPARSFRTCITSPPYYGLRDYGVQGQIGLENTPEEYVEKLVKVFREVGRTLEDDGTLWLNIGDTYARQSGAEKQQSFGDSGTLGKYKQGSRKPPKGYKAKDLIGIPWMVAFALRKDGWYLRQDIIWSKRNMLPESVKDRCTRSHEYIFLLSKSQKYYYNYEAMQEFVEGEDSGLRNKRSVWTINTQPSPEAHFATFPTELPEICMRAGSKENDLVLDPFNGSGTTGVACMKWKRKYVGIEINPKYVTLSENRIDRMEYERSTPLFDYMEKVENGEI